MQPFPHHYIVEATGVPDGEVTVSSAALTPIGSAPPLEFDGPGDRWSPATLLLAALVDDFVLTFRAMAAASRFDWQQLTCTAQGTLNRVERVTQFTDITVRATLRLAETRHVEQAKRLLEQADENCLVSNSLATPVDLVADIVAT